MGSLEAKERKMKMPFQECAAVSDSKQRDVPQRSETSTPGVCQ